MKTIVRHLKRGKRRWQLFIRLGDIDEYYASFSTEKAALQGAERIERDWEWNEAQPPDRRNNPWPRRS